MRAALGRGRKMLVWLGFMGVGEDVLFSSSFFLSFFSFLRFFCCSGERRGERGGVGSTHA